MNGNNGEIKTMFRSWEIFVILADCFWIAAGIFGFISISPVVMPISRWGVLLSGVLGGAWCTRYTIRAYKGK